MYFRFTLFNVITLGVMALTAWVAVKRFAWRLESNWPLAYYALLVVYMHSFEGSLDKYWVFSGIICALFLRFEFLPRPLVIIVRALEIIVFAYVLWRGAVLAFLLW